MSGNKESDLVAWEEIVYTPTSSPPESVLADISEPRNSQAPTLAVDKEPEKDKNGKQDKACSSSIQV
jgi:hypothetical protein